MMLSLQIAPRVRIEERFESDRESLPFPRGGVHANATDHEDSTQNGEAPHADYAVEILRTIDRMQSSLDTFERELGAELKRELRTLGDVIARIGGTLNNDWPPAAA
jgi:hypothetical protein